MIAIEKNDLVIKDRVICKAVVIDDKLSLVPLGQKVCLLNCLEIDGSETEVTKLASDTYINRAGWYVGNRSNTYFHKQNKFILCIKTNGYMPDLGVGGLSSEDLATAPEQLKQAIGICELLNYTNS